MYTYLVYILGKEPKISLVQKQFFSKKSGLYFVITLFVVL